MPTRLFCWSGGGLPGLDIHCGIWKALEAAGVTATANAGTSAGAFTAALNSSGMMPHGAERMLRNLSTDDVIRYRWMWWLRLNSADSMMDAAPIRRLCHELLPINFNSLVKPLSVHVTDDVTGAAVEIAKGNLPLAVAASMAIAGVWEPVHVYPPAYGRFAGGPGKWYSDGGTTENLPLPENIQAYDEVWLLIAKRPLAYKKRGETILSRLMYNLDMLIEAQVRETVSSARRIHRCVRVIRPAVDAPLGSFKFDHALIDEASVASTLQISRALNGNAEAEKDCH